MKLVFDLRHIDLRSISRSIRTKTVKADVCFSCSLAWRSAETNVEQETYKNKNFSAVLTFFGRNWNTACAALKLLQLKRVKHYRICHALLEISPQKKFGPLTSKLSTQ